VDGVGVREGLDRVPVGGAGLAGWGCAGLPRDGRAVSVPVSVSSSGGGVNGGGGRWRRWVGSAGAGACGGGGGRDLCGRQCQFFSGCPRGGAGQGGGRARADGGGGGGGYFSDGPLLRGAGAFAFCFCFCFFGGGGEEGRVSDAACPHIGSFQTFHGQMGMQRSQPRGMAAFLQPQSHGAASSRPSRSGDRIVDMPASCRSSSSRSSSSSSSRRRRRRRGTGAATLARAAQYLATFAIAAAMGQAGQWAERQAGLPGAAAAATTAFSLAAYGLCRRLAPGAFHALARRAPSLSAFLFALFFAAIGAGASLPHLLLSGPCVLFLMGLALAVHVATTALAVRLHNAAMVTRGGPACQVGLDEWIVASNAAIGGPATAAAMAASIGRPDLVLAATTTGTLGYSLATALGVALHGWLLAGSSGRLV
jgi:hypothetical protein